MEARVRERNPSPSSVPASLEGSEMNSGELHRGDVKLGFAPGQAHQEWQAAWRQYSPGAKRSLQGGHGAQGGARCPLSGRRRLQCLCVRRARCRDS